MATTPSPPGIHEQAARARARQLTILKWLMFVLDLFLIFLLGSITYELVSLYGWTFPTWTVPMMAVAMTLRATTNFIGQTRSIHRDIFHGNTLDMADERNAHTRSLIEDNCRLIDDNRAFFDRIKNESPVTDPDDTSKMDTVTELPPTTR